MFILMQSQTFPRVKKIVKFALEKQKNRNFSWHLQQCVFICHNCFKLISRITLASASMSSSFNEWEIVFLLSIWVVQLLGLDFHRGPWIWNVWILTILPLPFVFILWWSTIINKIWNSWIMSINSIMYMMQFLTIVGSCKLNEDLNGFYLMQSGGVTNVITFLGISIVVKLGDGDAKQFHYCYFYVYTCCLLLCMFLNWVLLCMLLHLLLV